MVRNPARCRYLAAHTPQQARYQMELAKRPFHDRSQSGPRGSYSAFGKLSDYLQHSGVPSIWASSYTAAVPLSWSDLDAGLVD